MIGTFDFWPELAVSFIGGVSAGACVLGIGYWLIDRRLRIRDRADDETRRRQDESTRREATLRAVHAELDTNAASLQLQMRLLADKKISYPMLDIEAIRLALDTRIYTTLSARTAMALTLLVARSMTANDMHAQLFDLTHGPTGIQAALLSRAGSGMDETYARFQAYRERVRDGLLDRLRELAPHLYEAIDAVENELGVTGAEPAAQRDFSAPAVGVISLGPGEAL